MTLLRGVMMVLSKKKKRIANERILVNPEEKCIKCGRSLKGTIHHFYCEFCHWGDWKPWNKK